MTHARPGATVRVTVVCMTDRPRTPAWLIPAAQWRADHAGPAPDRRPLDDVELEQLRRRLDAPGGERLDLDARELRAYYEQLHVIRTPEAVQELARTVRAESAGARPDGRAYATGILDAIAWAQGHRPTSPITGQPATGTPPAVEVLLEERNAALEVLRRERDTWRPRHYAEGVEAALAWLTASVDDPPW